jgi:hypothetical protein
MQVTTRQLVDDLIPEFRSIIRDTLLDSDKLLQDVENLDNRFLLSYGWQS